MSEAKYQGLSTVAVQKSREQHGDNNMNPKQRLSLIRKIWNVIKEPMFLLLLIAASIYFIVGKFTDGLIMLASVLVSLGLDFFQSEKTNKALSELDRLSAANVNVIRSGKIKKLNSQEIVVGDIVLLKEGDRVPADGKILEAQSLGVDESALTGESATVYKTNKPHHTKNHFLPNYCYAGTYVVNGSAVIEITQVGFETKLGKIGESFDKITPPKTPLVKQFNKITKIFAIISITTCVLISIVTFFNMAGEPDLGTRLTQALLAGIAVAISAIPEEIPLVLTVFLALGARNLAKQNTLTRNIKAIENLGAITVLCTDKTGTLTANKMVVQDAYVVNENFYQAAYYACPADEFDPMETAIKQYCKPKIKSPNSTLQIIHEYPFTAETKYMGQIWSSKKIRHHQKHYLYVKGALESVLPLCRLTRSEKNDIIKKAENFAKQGYRVLAIAESAFTSSQHFPKQLSPKLQMSFLGLIALFDPIRPGIRKSLDRCRTAGIRVIMITGDNGETAKGIARSIKLATEDNVLTGAELERMTTTDLRKAVKTTDIFSRVYPEHKNRIVAALQANGEVVAMTGDGINDAPALRQADVGIAMGKRGTHVAEEAADLILLDDNFNTIVSAIAQGRSIYQNIKKAVTYIISIHVPILLLALLIPLFGWTPLLMPVSIVLLELLIDPTCSIIFQRLRPSETTMQVPPRKLKQPFFTKSALTRCLVQGLIITGVVITLYGLMLNAGIELPLAITIAYVTLVFSLIFTSYQTQSHHSTLTNIIRGFKDPVAIGINIFIIIILCGVVYLPIFNDAASTTPLDITHWGVAILCAIVTIIPIDIYKLLKRK